MVFLTGHTTTNEREAGMVVVLRGKLVNLMHVPYLAAVCEISFFVSFSFLQFNFFPSSFLPFHASLTVTFIDLICCPSLVKPPLFTLRTLFLWCLSFFPSLLFFHFPFIVCVSHFCFHPSLFSVHVFLLPPVIFPL